MRVSITSPLVQPSPNGRRVGIRIVTFEACSGFTHVTARRIAQPPKATFVTRLQPFRLPGRAARQLPDQSTTLWVESSSTSDPRLRGALPGPDMRSRRASAPGPADGCFLSVRQGARDLRDQVPKLRGLGTCVLTPEKAAPGRNRWKPKSIPLRDHGAHHFPPILSTKRQRSILMFANQVIWGTSANIGL